MKDCGRARWQWRAAYCGLAIWSAVSGRAVLAVCVGDCMGDNHVSVDELVRGVNIALAALPLSDCAAFDVNQDSAVSIDELLLGVNATVDGCPALPPTATQTVTMTTPQTPTPTASCTPGAHPAPGCQYEGPTITPTPITPTPVPTASVTPGGPSATATKTPLPFGRAVAGHAPVISTGLNSFAPLVTAAIIGLQTGAGGPALACPRGGQAMRICSGTGSVTIGISFLGCTLDTPDGGTLTFESGTITLRGPGTCPNVVVAAPVLDESAELQATFRNQGGEATLFMAVSLNSSITAMNVNPGVRCFLTGGAVALNGVITTEAPNGTGARAEFQNTAMTFAIDQFNDDCLPLLYLLTLNGSGTLTETASGQSFDVTLTDFRAKQVGVHPSKFDLSGDVTAPCLGGTVSLQTLDPLSQEPGSACYNAGLFTVTSAGDSQQVHYLMTEGVELDTNNDGTADEAHASCMVPALLACSS